MAHFLLRCSHTRSLHEIDDAELDKLVDNPQSIPRFVWCDSCTVWQPISKLVTVAVLTDHGGEDEPMVDDEVNAPPTAMDVPGPRAGDSSGTANRLESSPGMGGVDAVAPHAPPTVGRHRRSSQSEEYAR